MKIIKIHFYVFAIPLTKSVEIVLQVSTVHFYLLKFIKIMYSRDETFKRSLAKLREDILRANGLAREANNFAEEFGRSTRFSVTLQIPPQNLSPNRKVSRN